MRRLWAGVKLALLGAALGGLIGLGTRSAPPPSTDGERAREQPPRVNRGRGA